MDHVLAQPNKMSDEQPKAMSLKKLRKGDGSWTMPKVLLGWVVDTMHQTLELPPHRKLELFKLLNSLCQACRISWKQCERALRKPLFMAVAIPGAQGLLELHN